MNTLSYRKWAYLSTILTGFSALCAQVIWQRYLAILVGSEARSLTLVVAVFLAGLAAGYYVFGLITERKKWSRGLLLTLYGYVELITAFYIGLFFIYFNFLKAVSFHSPSYFIIDTLVSLLALLLPTFLMGASIPILTATLPNSSEEINTIHAKVYGWNTLGACLGTLLSGFFLLPIFGLDYSLILAGIVNLLASLIFIKNPLKGDVHKQEKLPVIPSSLSNRFYLIFTFLTGAIIISFEVFFVRILHLSTGGARVYNFPLILAIFIGGLALGSLSISKNKISVKYLIQQLLNTIFLLGVLFWIMPYWPLWFSNIRSILGFMPDDYVVYQILVFLLMCLFLFPAVFCMGQFLPLVYALLKKNQKNYGRVCGYLYFCNTLGTVVGAVGIGYLSLYIFNIDHLFKFNIYILLFLAFIIAFFEKRRGYITALVCFGLIFAFLPMGWNRTEYYPTYTYKSKPHVPIYKEWFFLTKQGVEVKDTELVYFKDGPNTTVSVNKNFRIKETDMELDFNPALPFYREKYFSYNLRTNGKGDGSIIGEFSTFFLIPGLAYLFAPSQSKNLSAAVVGLGTGISTGVLSQLKDVKEVSVLEISPKVVKGISLAPSHLNFEIFHNKKVNIIEIDAFKYFTKTRKKFDIIVSQPSNLWVAGVENLFSQDFYQLARKSLSSEGILGQWLQNYGIDERTLRMILHTLRSVFPYTELYKIGPKDILILASLKPLDYNVSDKKFFDPFLNAIFKSFGIYNKQDVSLSRIFSSSQYEQIMSFYSKDRDIHTLTKPKLSYLVDKTFFLSQDSDPFDIKPVFMKEEKMNERKIKSFQRYKNDSPEIWKKRCPELSGFQFLCVYMQQALKAYQFFTDESNNYPARLNSYSFLRRHGLINHDSHFLSNVFSGIIKKKYLHENTPFVYVNERVSQGDYETAYAHIALLKEEKMISEDQYQMLKEHIDKL